MTTSASINKLTAVINRLWEMEVNEMDSTKAASLRALLAALREVREAAAKERKERHQHQFMDALADARELSPLLTERVQSRPPLG